MRDAHHRILQVILLVLWIGILVADGMPGVCSQAPCVPPMVTPRYMDPITITNGSFAPALQVTVRIDSLLTSNYDGVKARIEAGVKKWNPPATCSGVQFGDFSVQSFSQSQIDNQPPDGHFYWMLAEPTGNEFGRVFGKINAQGRVIGGRFKLRPGTQISDLSLFDYLGSHETGHLFNLDDCTSQTIGGKCTGAFSIMAGHGNAAFNTAGPTQCDLNAVNNIYCPSPSPTPSPSPSPSPSPNDQETCEEDFSWFWNPFTDTCQEEAPPPCSLEPEVCYPGSWSFTWCGCVPYSTPIVIDVLGNGFNLTSAENGVVFNLNNIGGMEKIAWTQVGSDDAWLVLDRNNNGTIDDGTEMFGDVAPQPEPPAGAMKNGFLALAAFDKPANGGNGDGLLSNDDSIFTSLRLWQDLNKNAVSEPSELHSLESLDLKTIELDFKESKWIDEHGNQFKYRAKVKDERDAKLGRWAWDVVLVRRP